MAPASRGSLVLLVEQGRAAEFEQPGVPPRVSLSRAFPLGKQVLQLRARVPPRLTDGALGAAALGPTEMLGSLCGGLSRGEDPGPER